MATVQYQHEQVRHRPGYYYDENDNEYIDEDEVDSREGRSSESDSSSFHQSDYSSNSGSSGCNSHEGDEYTDEGGSRSASSSTQASRSTDESAAWSSGTATSNESSSNQEDDEEEDTNASESSSGSRSSSSSLNRSADDEADCYDDDDDDEDEESEMHTARSIDSSDGTEVHRNHIQSSNIASASRRHDGGRTVAKFEDDSLTYSDSIGSKSTHQSPLVSHTTNWSRQSLLSSGVDEEEEVSITSSSTDFVTQTEQFLTGHKALTQSAHSRSNPAVGIPPKPLIATNGSKMFHYYTDFVDRSLNTTLYDIYGDEVDDGIESGVAPKSRDNDKFVFSSSSSSYSSESGSDEESCYDRADTNLSPTGLEGTSLCKGTFIKTISDRTEYEQYEAENLIKEFYETVQQRRNRETSNIGTTNNNNTIKNMLPILGTSKTVTQKDPAKCLVGVEYDKDCIQEVRTTNKANDKGTTGTHYHEDELSEVNPIGRHEARSAFHSCEYSTTTSTTSSVACATNSVDDTTNASERVLIGDETIRDYLGSSRRKQQQQQQQPRSLYCEPPIAENDGEEDDNDSTDVEQGGARKSNNGGGIFSTIKSSKKTNDWHSMLRHFLHLVRNSGTKTEEKNACNVIPKDPYLQDLTTTAVIPSSVIVATVLCDKRQNNNTNHTSATTTTTRTAPNVLPRIQRTLSRKLFSSNDSEDPIKLDTTSKMEIFFISLITASVVALGVLLIILFQKK